MPESRVEPAKQAVTDQHREGALSISSHVLSPSACGYGLLFESTSLRKAPSCICAFVRVAWLWPQDKHGAGYLTVLKKFSGKPSARANRDMMRSTTGGSTFINSMVTFLHKHDASS